MQGEDLFIPNSGYFVVSNINGENVTILYNQSPSSTQSSPTTNSITLPSGEKGKRGENAEQVAQITRVQWKGDQLVVQVNDPELVLSGSTVYVEGAGYFFAEQYKKEESKFTFKLLQRGEGDDCVEEGDWL